MPSLVSVLLLLLPQEIADEKASADPDTVRATFAEIPMTIIENSVKKFYLEDFHQFCA